MNFKLFFQIFIILFFPGVLFSQNNNRLKISIDELWKFKKSEITDVSKISEIHDWKTVNIPHTWNVKDVSDDKPGYYRGIGWYTKTVIIPGGFSGKKLYLYFEGANQYTEVYVNGQLAGTHTGGYTAFCVPVSKFVKDEKQFNLAVKVDNSHNEDIPPLTADFTFYGGIYRDVYLLGTQAQHFNVLDNASSGIYISTPKVTDREARIRIKSEVVNNASSTKELILENILYNADHKEIARNSQKLEIHGNSSLVNNSELPEIKDPELWSPSNPYLYTLVSRIVEAGSHQISDEICNPVGLRYFSFDPDKGFFLNGKHLKLIGTNHHQDYQGLGNAVSDELLIRDMQMLKNMGANYVRISHYPQDPSLMEACDKLGLLTSVEIPIVNTITQSTAFEQNCLKYDGGNGQAELQSSQCYCLGLYE